MLSTDFKKYFDNQLIKYFRGVFAFDQIPKSIKTGEFYICNTANSYSEGEHWFVIYKPSNDVIECFDSLSIKKEDREKLKCFKYKGIRKIKFNITQVQADNTSSCGEFCIYFIYQRLYNNDLRFKELLSLIFTAENLNTNEERVAKYMSDLSTDTVENVSHKS